MRTPALALWRAGQRGWRSVRPSPSGIGLSERVGECWRALQWRASGNEQFGGRFEGGEPLARHRAAARNSGWTPAHPRWRPCARAKTRSQRYVSSSAAASAAQRDPYEVLGVSRSATTAEIKKAFYKLAKEVHPDTGPKGDKARFAEINAAYELLSDEKRRRQYDQYGLRDGEEAEAAGSSWGRSGGFGTGPGMSAEEILRQFSDFFGSGPGGFGEADAAGMDGGRGGGGGGFGVFSRGSNVEVRLDLSFMEAAHGTEKTVQVPCTVECAACGGTGAAGGRAESAACGQCRGTGQERYQRGFFAFQTTCRRCGGSGRVLRNACSACRGSGVSHGIRTASVRVPAGVDSGQTLRVSGKGEAAPHGGPAGDLFVRVNVLEDPYFHREGPHLHVVAPITFADAALGGSVRVRTLDGDTEVKVPRGTQTDDVRVMRGRGIAKLGNSGHGNQYVHFRIQVPTELTPRERELVEALRHADLERRRQRQEAASDGRARSRSGTADEEAAAATSKNFFRRLKSLFASGGE